MWFPFNNFSTGKDNGDTLPSLLAALVTFRKSIGELLDFSFQRGNACIYLWQARKRCFFAKSFTTWTCRKPKHSRSIRYVSRDPSLHCNFHIITNVELINRTRLSSKPHSLPNPG